MNAMLMGGIVPTDLSQNFVTNYITTPLRRSKSFKWGTATFTARTWEGLIDQICPTQKGAIIKAISDFLQASSSYGLIDGVRGLQVLKAARVQLINLGRPAVDLAMRIMKDMRKPVNNRSEIARRSFYAAETPLIGVRHMQFAPGFGYYDNQITPLPKYLQTRLDKLYQDPGRMRRSAVRARALRDKLYPAYTKPFVMPLVARNAEIPIITRVKGDTTAPRIPSTNEVLRERAARAKRTLAQRITDTYRGLDPLYQYAEEPFIFTEGDRAATEEVEGEY